MKNFSKLKLSDVVVLNEMQMKLVKGGFENLQSIDDDGGGGQTPSRCSKKGCKGTSDCPESYCVNWSDCPSIAIYGTSRCL